MYKKQTVFIADLFILARNQKWVPISERMGMQRVVYFYK